MNFECLQFEASGEIAVLTLSRPEALNALNTRMLSELEQLFTDIGTQYKAMIVTGSGDKAFVAGADIKEMNAVSDAVKFAEKGQHVMQLIEDCRFPIIAAVNGYALGGGLELAMACDFIVASDQAKFGLPEVSLGIIPSYGGTQRLSRYLGKAKARMLVSTGDIYSAQKACELGLVAELVGADSLLDRCHEIASSIAKRSPQAVRLAKQAVNEGYDLSQADGLKLEADLFGQAFASDDKVEGVNAFIEKRTPKFKMPE